MELSLNALEYLQKDFTLHIFNINIVLFNMLKVCSCLISTSFDTSVNEIRMCVFSKEN